MNKIRLQSHDNTDKSIEELVKTFYKWVKTIYPESRTF